jgi:predicted secreted hydrolase
MPDISRLSNRIRLFHRIELQFVPIQWKQSAFCLFGLMLFLPLTLQAATPMSQAKKAAPKANTSASFTQAMPGYTYQFPRDHAAHPDYKTEWWYYTGHLKSQSGRTFGYELTFFRIGTGIQPLPKPSPWSMDQLYMAHFALTDDQGQRFEHTEQLNRPGMGRAGASTDRYHVWNKTWFAESLPATRQAFHSGQKANNNPPINRNGNNNGESVRLQASMPAGSLHLNLEPAKPLVIHGEKGVSRKADCVGCSSHYYSFTRLRTAGELVIGNERIPVTGTSWMDHEFGSNQMTPEQTGWDWFSVQLDDGSELMLYRLRRQDGSADPNSSGSWVAAGMAAMPSVSGSGTAKSLAKATMTKTAPAEHLRLNEYSIQAQKTWVSPVTKGRYPSGWRVTVPKQQLTLEITPTVANQELAAPSGASGGSRVSYWEGRCKVTGSHHGKPIQGQAYVELTGYAGRFKQRI